MSLQNVLLDETFVEGDTRPTRSLILGCPQSSGIGSATLSIESCFSSVQSLVTMTGTRFHGSKEPLKVSVTTLIKQVYLNPIHRNRSFV